METITELGDIRFDMPKTQNNIIKVIGVGGGGSNAVNYMYKQGIKGVDYVICNTDAQALEKSPILSKIQLGVSLTEGLGAGADPEVGEKSALESISEIESMLGLNTKMVFITAGMGGGTGTGAAPIIAKICKEMGILTVGIVTSPFQFEGEPRFEQAQKGIEKMREHVDSLIVINNNKLRDVYGNLGIRTCYAKADEVLSIAAKGIAEVITKHFDVNIDLRDAKTILSNSGTAIMGSARGKGEGRALQAVTGALDSPLLNDNKILGAKNVLLLIVYGKEEITMDETSEINEYIQKESGNNYRTNIIMGIGEDESLEDEVVVTVIATGFNSEQQHEIIDLEQKKIVHTLGEEQHFSQELDTTATFTDITFENSVKQYRDNNSRKIVHSLEKEDNDQIDDIPVSNVGITSIQNVQMPTPTMATSPKTTPTITETSTQSLKTSVEESKSSSNNFDLQAYISKNPLSNIPVYYEIISVKQNEVTQEQEEFIVYTTKKEKVEEVKNVKAQKIVPIVEEKVVVDLFVDVEEVKVPTQNTKTSVKEINPQPIVTESGQIRHNLEEYMKVEETLTKAAAPSKIDIEEEVEEEMQFQTRMISQEENIETFISRTSTNTEEISNQEHLKELRAGADNRRKTFKAFNHTFSNASSKLIRELDEIPAYKRQGIEPDAINQTQNNVSRLSLDLDSNNTLQIRNNNSFLHDNVD